MARSKKSNPEKNAQSKRRTKAKPGTMALKEIKKLQASTELIIPRKPFIEAVKQITENVGGTSFRFTKSAIEALREAAEAYLVRLFEDGSLQAVHAHRITLMVSDMKLVLRLRNK